MAIASSPLTRFRHSEQLKCQRMVKWPALAAIEDRSRPAFSTICRSGSSVERLSRFGSVMEALCFCADAFAFEESDHVRHKPLPHFHFGGRRAYGARRLPACSRREEGRLAGALDAG